MSTPVLYISGPAVDRTNAEIEQSYTDASIKSLEASGARITVVGNAFEGFSLQELTGALAANKTTTTLIVDAHGNATDDEHFMRRSKDELIWARDFYKTVGEIFGARPVNLFLFSCGSGCGLKAAQKSLPRGSTIFNLVTAESINSYSVRPESLSLAGQADATPAEALFVNIMTRGLPPKWTCDPCLTVANGISDKDKIHELWKLATSFCCDWADQEFPKEFIDSAQLFLKDHLDADRMAVVLDTMQYFSEQVLHDGPAFPPPHLTPVHARYTLDEEDFKSQVVTAGLLGPIGALAYAICRDDLGAFQRPVVEYPMMPA